MKKDFLKKRFLKKKVFKNNSLYKKEDLSSFKRIYEIVRTFFISRNNWLSGKDCKNYFKQDHIKNWMSFVKTEKSSFQPVVTWIGHSTFLIQIAGVNILTDPVFSDLMYLYPRNTKPGIEFEKLPKIDFVIISHNHKDHMEKKTLLKLKKDKPTFLVPMGNKDWFDFNGFDNVLEFDWWQQNQFDLKDNILGKIKFSFLPAIHWSGNGISSVNKSLWGSWMIECAGFTMYFAGDTAYSNHFKDISKKFSKIDLAFMPIGPDSPRRFQKLAHVNAKQAVDGFID